MQAYPIAVHHFSYHYSTEKWHPCRLGEYNPIWFHIDSSPCLWVADVHLQQIKFTIQCVDPMIFIFCMVKSRGQCNPFYLQLQEFDICEKERIMPDMKENFMNISILYTFLIYVSSYKYSHIMSSVYQILNTASICGYLFVWLVFHPFHKWAHSGFQW